MFDQKYELCYYSFYDTIGMKKHLEKMAAKGWFLDGLKKGFWRYKKGTPKKLSYAVSYYAKASQFEPEPGEDQKRFQEYCEFSGWKLAAESDKLQIFYTEEEEAVPIYTDPFTEIDAIKAVSGPSVAVYMILMILGFLQLYFLGKGMSSNRIGLLANAVLAGSTVMVTLFSIYCGLDLIWYFIWKKKAEQFAEQGEFLSTHLGLNVFLKIIVWFCVLWITVNFLAEGYTGGTMWMLLYFGGMMFLFVAVNGVRNYLKKRNVPTNKNRMITLAVDVVLSILLVAAFTSGIFIKMGSPEEKNQDGELLLSGKQLTGKDAYRVYKDQSESILIRRERVDQHIESEDQSGFFYDVADIRFHPIKDYCLNYYLHWYDDYTDYEAGDDPEIQNYSYQKTEAGVWNADRAWQQYHHGKPSEHYLLFYGTRIVELKTEWELTDEQKKICGEQFSTKE